MLSQSMPNNCFVNECLRSVCSFNVKAVSTINGKSAGKTLYAQMVIPSIKLCIYLVGDTMKIINIVPNSSAEVRRKYFTTYYI